MMHYKNVCVLLQNHSMMDMFVELVPALVIGIKHQELVQVALMEQSIIVLLIIVNLVLQIRLYK